MSRASEAAEKIATSQMNCSQAVLSAYCEELGMEKRTALKTALAFGAGMGRTSGICGAVTGAYMVLGLRDYPDIDNPVVRKEKVYSLVGEFNRRFKAINNSIDCSDLIGCNLGTPEGQAAAREGKRFASVCPKFVSDAVIILEELSE